MAVLEAVDLVKRFPGVLALNRFSISFNPGTVHALVGENGAGKSTLVKILSGVYTPTSGSVLWEGKPVHFSSPRDAAPYVGVVHQECELIPHFSGYENLFLGMEYASLGLLRKRRMRDAAENFLQKYRMDLDLSRPAQSMSNGQQAMLAILKVLFRDPRAVIFDEPTAPLSITECEILFSLIDDLRQDGRAVLYISHHLSEVLRIADRVTVMRNGALAGTVRAKDTDEDGLIRLMIAKDLGNQYPKVKVPIGEEIFSAQGYSAPRAGVRDADFFIRSGEIVGFAGLVGAGRTELAKSVFTGSRGSSGTLTLAGKPFLSRSARHSISRGVVMIPENRREEGLITGMSAGDNLTIPTLAQHTRLGFVNASSSRGAALGAVAAYGIKLSGLSQIVRTLSGGNQQKVSVGKWDKAAAILWIFDEPTQGIDVDAKTEIYSIMGRMARSGAGIWFISSELRELTAVADRIYVMRDGRITAEYTAPYDKKMILDSMIR